MVAVEAGGRAGKASKERGEGEVTVDSVERVLGQLVGVCWLLRGQFLRFKISYIE